MPLTNPRGGFVPTGERICAVSRTPAITQCIFLHETYADADMALVKTF